MTTLNTPTALDSGTEAPLEIDYVTGVTDTDHQVSQGTDAASRWNAPTLGLNLSQLSAAVNDGFHVARVDSADRMAVLEAMGDLGITPDAPLLKALIDFDAFEVNDRGFIENAGMRPVEFGVKALNQLLEVWDRRDEFLRSDAYESFLPMAEYLAWQVVLDFTGGVTEQPHRAAEITTLRSMFRALLQMGVYKRTIDLLQNQVSAALLTAANTLPEQ